MPTNKYVTAFVLVLLMAVSLFLSQINYLLFHTLIELFCIIIAFSLGLIVFNTRKITKSNFFLFIGIAYSFVALFDLLHLITYKGMAIFQIQSANLATQFWIGGRFLESISLVLAFFYLERKLNYVRIFTVYSIITLTLSGLIVTGNFPACYIEGAGLTAFKIISEYLIIAILIIAFYLFSKKRTVLREVLARFVGLSIILTVFAEISFTLYQDVYGILNLVGHLFKLLSYYVVYKYLAESSLKSPFNFLFYQLNQSNKKLKKKSTDLLKTNQRLMDEIEQHKMTENALRKSQKLNQAIIDSLNASIAVLDQDGEIMAINKIWERFGLKNNREIIDDLNRNYLTVVKKGCQEKADSACKVLKGLEDLLAGKIDLFSEEYPCHSAEEKRWFLLQATPLDIPEGGAVLAHISITDRKEAENRLLKLTQAVEQSSSTVVITDLEGNIEYVNPKFSETSGYAREEAIGKNPRILKSGVQDDAVYEELWSNISSGQEWKGELWNKRKNGELYWEYASISPVKNNHGEITSYIAIKEDITARKEMERQLKEAKKEAELASQAKSNFLAQMSHDIRTPMTGIIGMSDLMLKKDLPEEIKSPLKIINDSAGILLDLINDILDLSKIEAGKMTLDKKPFNLDRVMKKVINTFRFEADSKGLELNFRSEPGLPDWLIGDPGRLRQVLINLIGNAIKFTAEGEVSLEIRQKESAGDRVVLEFSVQDTGIGIPEDEYNKLFQRFSQISNNRQKQQGTGLGLVISKQLVELMGGKIGVKSKPGEGSAFIFTATFGLSEGRELAEESTKWEKAELDKIQDKEIEILVVEDNPVNQEIIGEILNRMGWDIVIASTGNEALKLVEKRDFDLIFMDIQLPEMDGYTVTEKIRKLEAKKPDKKYSPIIAMTAYATSADKEHSQQVGMDDYLSKPIVAEDIYRKIYSIIIDKKQEESRSNSYFNNLYPCNLAQIAENTNYNYSLILKIFDIFKRNYQKQLTLIEEAITDKNPVLLQTRAHGFKGAVSNLASDRCMNYARQLEERAKSGKLQDALTIFNKLKKEVERVVEFIDDVDLSRLKTHLNP